MLGAAFNINQASIFMVQLEYEINLIFLSLDSKLLILDSSLHGEGNLSLLCVVRGLQSAKACQASIHLSLICHRGMEVGVKSQEFTLYAFVTFMYSTHCTFYMDRLALLSNKCLKNSRRHGFLVETFVIFPMQQTSVQSLYDTATHQFLRFIIELSKSFM